MSSTRSTSCLVSTHFEPEGFGEDTLNSFLQIKKSGESSYYEFGTPKCSDLGIWVDVEGVRRLALSDEPFLVVFKKAQSDEPERERERDDGREGSEEREEREMK